MSYKKAIRRTSQSQTLDFFDQVTTSRSSRANECLSMAWRCEPCGRLHLRERPTPEPETCGDCGGRTFSFAGPNADQNPFPAGIASERRRNSRLKP
jgi:rubrerythrin